jgi:hypothetical protein
MPIVRSDLRKGRDAVPRQNIALGSEAQYAA